MTEFTELPLITCAKDMFGDSSSSPDAKIKFHLEADTGEMFEISFSLKGILTFCVMANNWTPLREALVEIAPSTIIRQPDDRF